MGVLMGLFVLNSLIIPPSIKKSEYEAFTKIQHSNKQYWTEFDLYTLSFDKKFKIRNIDSFLKWFGKTFDYKKDEKGIDHPQYPYETLYLKEGDCEDLSILMASILYQNKYDVYTVEWKKHISLAIMQDGVLKHIEPLLGFYDYSKEEQDILCIDKVGDSMYECLEME